MNAISRRDFVGGPGSLQAASRGVLRHAPDCGMFQVVPARWSRRGTAGTRTMAAQT